MKILYRGCVVSGNLGDDILFYIFKKIFTLVLTKSFTCNIIGNEKKNNQIWDIDTYDIFVIGGGSIIHPLETSYTAFGNNYKKLLFINGTGITDCNKIKGKENIDYYDKNKILDKFSFDDKNIRISFNRIHNFNVNKNVYGGFRGLFEERLYNFYNNSSISYINDIGILSNIIYKEENKSVALIESYNRNIILINPIRATGIDCLKDKEQTTQNYNYFIDNVLFIVSKILIQKGYFIYIADFTNGLNKYYYDKIILLLQKDDMKYIDYMIPTKQDIQTSLSIIKQCYFVIGTRLHTNIIANSFLIPSIHIAYGVKHINYCLTNNLPNSYIPTYSKYLSSEALIEKINYNITNYDEIVKTLKLNHDKAYTKYCMEIKNMISRLNIHSGEYRLNYTILDSGTTNIILDYIK